MAKVACFSPLFIGALSSTQHLPSAQHLAACFSPLFIGALSSTRQTVSELLLAKRFSPLFIGALSSTCFGSLSSTRSLEFQSPLHRGTLFNEDRARDLMRAIFVSVPSSSGHSLQPFARCGPSLRPPCFSPLFIGALSSTSSI